MKAKKERPLEYTGLPVFGGVAIMKLSEDGQTRDCVAQVMDNKYYDDVFNAIRKIDGFGPTK